MHSRCPLSCKYCMLPFYVRFCNNLKRSFSFKTLPEGGKILYHPDAEDDLDEEDPDDDLLI